MARATITYHFATGEAISCSTSCNETFPDAIAEVGANTRRLYREVMEDQRAAEALEATDAEGQ